MGVRTYLTPLCAECDWTLAAKVAALPADYRQAIIATVERLVETYAALSGTKLPEPPLPSNVVRLRTPHRR